MRVCWMLLLVGMQACMSCDEPSALKVALSVGQGGDCEGLCTAFLACRRAAVMGMLIPVFGYKAICSIMCLTSSMILVNITAPMDQARFPAKPPSPKLVSLSCMLWCLFCHASC
jgi:hypothetical protein